MELIIPMLFLELGFVFLIVALFADRVSDYTDVVSIILILSIVAFFIAGYGMYQVTDTVTTVSYDSSLGTWVNETINQRSADYEWLGLPCIGLAFFVLLLLFLKLMGYIDGENE